MSSRLYIKMRLEEIEQRIEGLQASLELANQLFPENLDVLADIVRELVKTLKKLPCLQLDGELTAQADA